VVFFGAVPTVWYILELFQQCGIFWSCSNSVVYFGAVPTVWYILELFQQCLLEQLQKIPHFWNSSKKYHTVGTAPKNTTLLEELQNIPHCWNSSKIYHTVGTAPKYSTLLEQLQKIQCGIFWSCSNSVVFFGAVPTVWYILELFQQCGIFWSCSNSVVYLIYHTVGTAPKYTTLLEQLQKIPHCWNSSKKYHTVGIAPKNTTLLEQIKKILRNIVDYFGRSTSYNLLTSYEAVQHV
jgi:hypothetical protein